MNVANVMAISPKPGAGKVQMTRTVSKPAADMNKDSFGEVLGKAGEEVTGKLAKSPVDSQGSVQGNVDAKEADIKDDMPEGTETALTDKQTGKEAQAGKAAKDGKDAQEANATEGTNKSAEEQKLGKLAAQAAVLNFSPEGQAVLVMEEVPRQAEPAATVNLQSLLPQSSEDAQKNKNFLAMLSGQQVKVTGKETAVENIPQDFVKPQGQEQLTGSLNSNLQAARPATMLEAQLSNHQLANEMAGEGDAPLLTVLNDGKERLTAKGMAPFEQSETTMTSMPAGRVNDSVTLENTGRVIVPEGTVQLQPRKEDNAQTVKNPLAGIRITVDEEVPVASPAMNMQQNFQQSNLNQQNQPQAPVMETVAVEDGETVNQLAEEAVGDKAPATAQQSANNEPVSMFQQSLTESLTGSRAADDVNQPQNVQDDFNVPRQIVEQARLLRRGEDTQMVIKLHPDHLGELTLKVSVSANGAVNASFHSDNAQVRAIIESTLVQLKQELNNQGLKVDNVDVYAGLTDGQLPQGEGQQAWQQNQGQSGSSIRNIGNVDDYGEGTEDIVAGMQSTAEAADGVDYRV